MDSDFQCPNQSVTTVAPGLKTGIFLGVAHPPHGGGSLRNRHRELIIHHVQAPAAGDRRNDDTKVVHGQRARALGTIESRPAPERSSIVPTRLWSVPSSSVRPRMSFGHDA